MTETVKTTGAWHQDPQLGDVYVLHVDGRPVAATALVDRNLGRDAQLQALSQVEWPPPQQITSVFTRTEEDRMPLVDATVLPGDRRFSPLLGGFAGTVDGDEPPSTHPVRRYLFPEVDRGGGLVLDAGERVLHTWKSFQPEILIRYEDGTIGPRGSGTYIPVNELKGHRCALTDQRLVFHGPISPPLGAREDSPSIFLPSMLFEGITTYRQIKRWASRGNLHWGFQIRHEWASEIAYGNIPDRKRPLLLRRDDTMFFIAGMRYPVGNASALFRLPYKEVAPEPRAIAEAYVAAVREAVPHAAMSTPIETRESIKAGVFTNKRETEVVTTWTVDGTVPWSLPARL